MIGYKITNNFKCGRRTFEIGKTYHYNNMLNCSNLTFFQKVEDVFYNEDFIILSDKNIKILEIESLGDIIDYTDPDEKFKIFRTNKLKVLREVPKSEWDGFEFDKNWNIISFKHSNGYWEKHEYDGNDNEIYFEDSECYLTKNEYDENNNLIIHKKFDKDTSGCNQYLLIEYKYAKNDDIFYVEEEYLKIEDGSWQKKKYDEHHIMISYEDSTGKFQEFKRKGKK